MAQMDPIKPLDLDQAVEFYTTVSLYSMSQWPQCMQWSLVPLDSSNPMSKLQMYEMVTKLSGNQIERFSFSGGTILYSAL